MSPKRTNTAGEKDEAKAAESLGALVEDILPDLAAGEESSPDPILSEVPTTTDESQFEAPSDPNEVGKRRDAIKVVSEPPAPREDAAAATEIEQMLAKLIATPESINESDQLKRFSKDCAIHRPRILIGGEYENGDYWVDALKGDKNSEALATAIRSQKTKLENQERLGRILKAIENTKDGQDLEDLAWDLTRDGYLIKHGRGPSFTVKAGKGFGGREIAQAVMAKKKEFMDKRGLGASLADLANKYNS